MPLRRGSPVAVDDHSTCVVKYSHSVDVSGSFVLVDADLVDALRSLEHEDLISLQLCPARLQIRTRDSIGEVQSHPVHALIAAELNPCQEQALPTLCQLLELVEGGPVESVRLDRTCGLHLLEDHATHGLPV